MDDLEASEVEETEVVETESFDVSDDAVYNFGEGDPVKGADLKSGWQRQSDYTRKTQELAQQRQAFEQQQQQWQQSVQQYQQQLQQYYQQMAQQQGRQEPQDPRAAIWEKAQTNGGIITVDEAKQLDQQWRQAFETQQAQMQQYMQALGMVHDRVTQLQTPLQQLHTSNTESQIESRLGKFLDDNNVPQGEVRTKLQGVLRQWEPTAEERQMGRDFEDTWDEILTTFTGTSKELERAQAEAAAKNLGRRGGGAAPSRGVKPPMSVDDIVNATWNDG